MIVHSLLSGATKRSGEKALMHAALVDAIERFQVYSQCDGLVKKRRHAELEEWFFIENESWPFSFKNICSVLDLDPGYIRAALQPHRNRARRNFRSPRLSTNTPNKAA